MATQAGNLGLRRLVPASDAFRALVEESRLDGFWMLVRLADGWADGRNRFSKRGETLFGAYVGGNLAGVCGLNVDPYVIRPRHGRVRHLYVGTDFRRRGVGRALVAAITERARIHFPVLNVRAPETAFGFYESLGFQRVADVTHRMMLGRSGPGVRDR